MSIDTRTLFLLLYVTLTWSAQAATVTFKDVNPPDYSRFDPDPPFSNLVSFREVGVKTGSDGSAETTYVEEIHNSQGLEPSGTIAQAVPLGTTHTFTATIVQSSNGFWLSEALPYTVTEGEIVTTTQLNYYRACSLVGDGKYGCVGENPRGGPTTYTNTAFEFVVTDVGELRAENAATRVSMAPVAWQIVSVLSAMLFGALILIH
ncbi:hypothetical protein PQX77_016624 [Marasmius sp. AFHP31]|nr:hypothetical protein PQX77_016624 [Marasmius sp. AFHP31]